MHQWGDEMSNTVRAATASDQERVWLALAEIHRDLGQVRGAICDLADAIDGRRPVPAAASRRRKAAPRHRHLRLVRDSAS